MGRNSDLESGGKPPLSRAACQCLTQVTVAAEGMRLELTTPCGAPHFQSIVCGRTPCGPSANLRKQRVFKAANWQQTRCEVTAKRWPYNIAYNSQSDRMN